MANTRLELLEEVVAKIISGNRSTTAANLREVLNDFIVAAYIPETDGPPTGKYKGKWVGGPYKNGDAVLHNLLFWEANQDNTGEEPGTGPSWDLQITNDDAYGFGYSGSLLGITQNRFRQIFEDLKANILSASIVDFGAKGDGVSDDTEAIQAAIDTGLTVFFPSTVLILGTKTIANYLISENLILNDNQKIYGHNSKVSSVTIGDSSSLSSAFNFFVCGTGTIIEGLNLIGSGKGTYVFPWTSQNGIWHQSGNNQVINCSFKDLAGSAILGVNGSLSIFNFNKIVNVTINSCTVGVFNYVGSEYQNIVGGSIVACNVGILELGANNSVIGCNVDYNDTGISIGNNGANSDHGDFIGGTLNHNSIPISCNGLAVGYIFSSVNIFDGIVNISQADKLIFSACAFENIDFEISATTTIKTVQFIGGYQIGTTSYAVTGTANIMKSGVIGDNESNYKISTDLELTDLTKVTRRGPDATNGSWRERVDSGDYVFEKYVSGSWVEKYRIS